MTDKTQPEAGSTHIIRYALELGLLWIDGDGRDKVREALDALDALEAKLASIGAGGVQALSAAPAGPNGDELRRIARSARTSASDDASPTEYVLAGWKAAMLAASHPAEQHAQPGAVYAELPLSVGEHKYGGGLFTKAQMRDFADRTHALRMEQAALKAAPGLPMQERPQENTLVWVADPTSSTGVKGFFADSVPCPWWYKAGLVFLREGDAAALGKSMRAVALSVPKAAPGEPDPADIIAGALQISRGHAIEMMREALEAAPQQEAQEPALFVSAKQLADLVDPSHATGGSYLPARKTRAGLFTQPLYTAPQPAPAPLSDDVVKDAARWRMVALIGNEVMLHPEKRTQAAAVKAYMDATHSGSDLTGAVDAALAAQGGKDAG